MIFCPRCKQSEPADRFQYIVYTMMYYTYDLQEDDTGLVYNTYNSDADPAHSMTTPQPEIYHLTCEDSFPAVLLDRPLRETWSPF